MIKSKIDFPHQAIAASSGIDPIVHSNAVEAANRSCPLRANAIPRVTSYGINKKEINPGSGGEAIGTQGAGRTGVIIVKTGVGTERKPAAADIQSSAGVNRNRIRPARGKTVQGIGDRFANLIESDVPSALGGIESLFPRAYSVRSGVIARGAIHQNVRPNGGEHDNRKQSTKESVAILVSCASKVHRFPSPVVCS